jgi:hypothetical protein
MVEGDEAVAWEERAFDWVERGWDAAVALLDGAGWEPDAVSDELEVGLGPALGVWVGINASPTNAVAPEVTDCGFWRSYALSGDDVKRHCHAH